MFNVGRGYNHLTMSIGTYTCTCLAGSCQGNVQSALDNSHQPAHSSSSDISTHLRVGATGTTLAWLLLQPAADDDAASADASTLAFLARGLMTPAARNASVRFLPDLATDTCLVSTFGLETCPTRGGSAKPSAGRPRGKLKKYFTENCFGKKMSPQTFCCPPNGTAHPYPGDRSCT